MSAMDQIMRSARLFGLTFRVIAHVPRSVSKARRRGRARSRTDLITTQGRGEVRVPPDSVRIDLGAEAQAPTLEEARFEVNRRLSGVVSAIERLAVPELSLQTLALQLYPIRDPQARDEPANLVGYRASGTIAATVVGAKSTALAEIASRVVDEGVSAGANVISGIRFFLKDVRGVESRALEAAVRDAEQNARAMASAAGVALGALRSIEGTPAFHGGDVLPRAYEAVAAVSTPVLAGEIVISSSVSARFSFAPRECAA
jgi:uncharacterized protein YggE